MKRIQYARTAVLLLLAVAAACSDVPTGMVATAADRPAALNAAPQPSVRHASGAPLVSWPAVTGAVSYTVVFNTRTTVLMDGRIYRGQYNRTLGSTTATAWLDGTNAYTGTTSCTYTDPTGYDMEEYRYQVTATFGNGTTAAYVAAPVGAC